MNVINTPARFLTSLHFLKLQNNFKILRYEIYLIKKKGKKTDGSTDIKNYNTLLSLL